VAQGRAVAVDDALVDGAFDQPGQGDERELVDETAEDGEDGESGADPEAPRQEPQPVPGGRGGGGGLGSILGRGPAHSVRTPRRSEVIGSRNSVRKR